MWPFSEMSLSTATLIGTIANWSLLGSLLVGVVATFLIVQTTDVKEDHWAIDRRESAERIAGLTTQGDQLRKDTADANARALEAQLELAKFKAPRLLTEEQQARIVGQIKTFSGQQYSALVAAGLDTWPFWTVLDSTLKTAGWKRVPPPGLAVGDPPAGIPISPEPGISIMFAPSRATDIGAAARALGVALVAEGIATALGR
jgi:hypothetical protein